MGKKCVAYVGSYTRGKSKGITIFDVDVENGKLYYRKEVDIHNPSYIKIDLDRKILYSIQDGGLTSFKIEKDGDLTFMNEKSINGMRGCFIDIDISREYIYVAGYHDGKITMMSLNEDGSLKEITDEIFLKGMGKPYEDEYRPHVSCCKLTPFNQYLCVADLSVNNYKVYRVNRESGKLHNAGLITCSLDSGPREIVFSLAGKYAYTVCAKRRQIEAFSYKFNEKTPIFDKIQTLTLCDNNMSIDTAPYAITLSHDGTFIVTSMVENNSVSFINRDQETGILTFDFNLPISGEFPKDIQLFPNDKFLVSVNHDSNQLTVFKVDREKKWITMTQRPVDIDQPNCIRFCELDV